MIFLAIGLALLALVLSLFSLKDRLQSPLLARIAHSELIMRFTVIAAALIFVGALLVIDRVFS